MLWLTLNSNVKSENETMQLLKWLRFVIIIIYREYCIFFYVYINKQVDYRTSKNLIFSTNKGRRISWLLFLFISKSIFLTHFFFLSTRFILWIDVNYNRINDIIAFAPEWTKTRLLGTELRNQAVCLHQPYVSSISPE